MTFTNLALWLGIHKETILRVLRNGDIDERFETFQTMKDIMDYSMEQDLTTYEGNPTGKIFTAKSRMGWLEGAQEININFGVQSQQSRPDSIITAQELIDMTPDID